MFTLLGTNISPFKAILKMIFLFSRWDMLLQFPGGYLYIHIWAVGCTGKNIFRCLIKTSVCKYGNIHIYIYIYMSTKIYINIPIHYEYTIYIYWIIEHIVWIWYSRYIHCTFFLSCKQSPSIPDMQKEAILAASMDGTPRFSEAASCNLRVQCIWCFFRPWI